MTSSILTAPKQPLRVTNMRAALGDDLERLPWCMRVLAENVLRHAEAPGAVAPLREWLLRRGSGREIDFRPLRLMMHDTTAGPALVDIAAMRDAMAAAGHDPAALNPVIPVDVSVDHSIAVDRHGTPDAAAFNLRREFERNAERFRLMKWAASTLRGFTVHPPGTGIMHTINLEQLATVVAEIGHRGAQWAVPDTLIGTDSHTPMVNGIGVLGWGVGGIEAESVMFGMPLMLRLPDVVGVRLTGRLREGVLSTDLALTVTERLRRHGVSGAFVEFFGPGVETLSCGDRAVVANMAPEYGATTGYFPIDDQTLTYLRQTGRSAALIERVRTTSRRLALWFEPLAEPAYSAVVDLPLDQIATSLAGPRRPHDRLGPAEVARSLPTATSAGSGGVPMAAVAIAAITSCTNTSDPRLLIAAGLLARKARAAGLRPPPWVKTSFAPGSPAAARYLARAGVLDDLAALGFGIVGYGCTTCIGNSGPLMPVMAAALDRGAIATAVLSGNRNFPGRVHSNLETGFLASPPLVVAYALAGDMAGDITADSLGLTPDGRPVLLRDLWPSGVEIDAALHSAADPDDYAAAFVAAGRNATWDGLDTPDSPLFPWDPASTYLRPPPFAAAVQDHRLGKYRARPLLVLGDDITTDHISPAGAVPLDSDAAAYLIAGGERAADLNVFAARRGNWEVMLRGLFTNRTVRNLLNLDWTGGHTIHMPTGEVLPIWRVAARYAAEATPVVLVAGARYGAGSSRDWAAKGTALLGVRAVLAESFERIHRANLIGMGILPVLLPAGLSVSELAIDAADWLEFDVAAESLVPRGPVIVDLCRANGSTKRWVATADIQTSLEVITLKSGGILPLIMANARS